ncbi:MAG TPA: D-alanyl-D-alanine carboxypeptidase/D-alanyl-D-alanine-endopeptidase [Polyangiaceae bacterium]|nr:D-alanyl-D-alanine carboxypeptidase/D-alanyl-D-alanine-endopeptidase [Polyangiaceae bacterium]
MRRRRVSLEVATTFEAVLSYGVPFRDDTSVQANIFRHLSEDCQALDIQRGPQAAVRATAASFSPGVRWSAPCSQAVLSTASRSPAALSRRALLAGTFAFSTGAFQRSALAQAASVSDALRASFDKLVSWAQRQRVALGAAVLEVSNGQPLLASGELLPLNPASNQKLLTMAAALERLGPAQRFSTSLHGRLTGDTLSELVLRGDGDPELTVTRLERMVRSLADQGVRRVAGDVLVDQSAFDARWDPPAYEQRPRDEAAYRAPVSAVALDGNLLVLHVFPSRVGASGEPSPARLWLEPPGLAQIEGSVSTVSSSPAGVSFSVLSKDGKLVARVGGSVLASGGEVSFSRRLPEPELAAGRVLLRLLSDHGIVVSGRLRSGGAEIQSELVALRSRSLGELLLPLGKQSDNFAAEMLLKALGARSTASSGTSAAGAAVLMDYLQKRGLLLPGTTITNGSGLFDANRLTALALARVLREAYLDPRSGPEFLAALSIGGTDGTLSHRFGALNASRRVRAKTGTLSDVIALSGFVFGSSMASARCFSFLLNGVSGHQTEAKNLVDRVVLALAAEAP